MRSRTKRGKAREVVQLPDLRSEIVAKCSRRANGDRHGGMVDTAEAVVDGIGERIGTDEVRIRLILERSRLCSRRHGAVLGRLDRDRELVAVGIDIVDEHARRIDRQDVVLSHGVRVVDGNRWSIRNQLERGV